MQGSIAQLQEQVGQVADLVSRSSDDSCLTATQGLQHLAGLQTANAEQAQQVCSPNAFSTTYVLALSSWLSSQQCFPSCTGMACSTYRGISCVSNFCYSLKQRSAYTHAKASCRQYLLSGISAVLPKHSSCCVSGC